MQKSGLISSKFVRRLLLASPFAVFTFISSQTAAAQAASAYQQTNIISDGSVQALHTDPTLINPWGVSLGPQFWIDSAGTGFSEVDDANGNKAFAVAVPSVRAGATHGNPAGTVANNDSSVFNIPGMGSALFIFGNLDGSIAAWNTNTPQAVTVANNSAAHAVYTDIAIDKNSTGTFLLAANVSAGTVDVFNSSFAAAHLAGNFSDPSLPQGYAPYGIHAIGSNIYVTYTQHDSAGHQVIAAGAGYVDVFDNNGNLIKEAISGGNLNAPWGMALAPAGFGSYGGKLLVGNFGDGMINVYDPTSFSYLGTLRDAGGAPIVNSGLWEIVFGESGLVGDPNTLYFAAGINGEKGGLFGSLKAAAPVGNPDFSFQASANSLTVTGGQTGSITFSLAASNGFSGAVSFSCSGLPTGDSCSFNPSTANVSGTSSVSVTASIATVTNPTPTPTPNPYIAIIHPRALAHGHPVMMLAFGLPFGLLGLAGLRKRTILLRGSLFALALALFTLSMTGCSSQTAMRTPTPTPSTSQVTIHATSGTISHDITLALTVN